MECDNVLLAVVAGFKSRALRVGGAVETPAAALAAAAAEHAAPAQTATGAVPPAQASSAEAGTAEDDEGEAAAGRKRRAAASSVPSPSVSPKLAAALRDGHQCRVQPGEEAAAAAASIATSRQSVPDACTSTDDDSVPLVGSKLAARVSQDRGTPMASRKGRDAGKYGCWLRRQFSNSTCDFEQAGAQVHMCGEKRAESSYRDLILSTGLHLQGSCCCLFCSGPGHGAVDLTCRRPAAELTGDNAQ